MGYRALRLGGITLLATLGCFPEDDDASAYASAWASALCEVRARCGCAATDCETFEAARFLQLWADIDTVPREPCGEDRLARLEALACDTAERHVFEWELMVCPLRTSFASVGEPCLVLGTATDGRTWRTCEAGLVCDQQTSRCAIAVPAPPEHAACLYSSDPYGSLGYCGPELVCMEGGVCRAGPPPTITTPLACSDAVYAL